MRICRWFGTWLLVNIVLSASLSPSLTLQIFAQTVKPATILTDSQSTKSAAYEWLDVALEATAREHERAAPGYLTPHWYRVKPFALERSDMFRPAAAAEGRLGAIEEGN